MIVDEAAGADAVLDGSDIEGLGSGGDEGEQREHGRALHPSKLVLREVECQAVIFWGKLLEAACAGCKLRQFPDRRDGRVVEGARLESVYRGNSIEGSNPSLSAI